MKVKELQPLFEKYSNDPTEENAERFFESLRDMIVAGAKISMPYVKDILSGTTVAATITGLNDRIWFPICFVMKELNINAPIMPGTQMITKPIAIHEVLKNALEDKKIDGVVFNPFAEHPVALDKNGIMQIYGELFKDSGPKMILM